MQIPQDVFDKVAEIRRLHDEAFHHYQKFDRHAKSYDGRIKLVLDFGTVWEPNAPPVLAVKVESYVVLSSWRENYYETIDDALEAMRMAHAKAMDYNPTEDELAEMDRMAEEFIQSLIDQRKLTVIDVEEARKNQSEE
jgi:hypothetical protein